MGRRGDRGGLVTLICRFALWPVASIWAYVDVLASGKKEWQL